MRTFIAVDIFQAAKDGLERTVSGLREMGLGDVRWVQLQGIHLTLKFLGEIDDAMVQPILAAAERSCHGTGSFELTLSGLGCFPNSKKPRVIWAGLEGDIEALIQLQARLDQELHLSCSFKREDRPFRPHLTLARVRDIASDKDRRSVGERIDAVPLPTDIRWTVSQINLIHSTLTPQGAKYRTLGSVML